MAELIWPAVDPTHRGGPTLLLDVPALDVLPPVPPIEPDPGDPDAPPPVPATHPTTYTLWGRRPGLLAPFLSANVDSYVVGELGPTAVYDHQIQVAGTDAGWSMLGAPTDQHGNPLYARIIDSITWELWSDTELVAEGRTEGELVAGPVVDLKISGGGAIWRDRYLGDGGLEDLLGGTGSFRSSSLAGWTFTGAIERRWNTTDPYDGGRALQVRGTGEIRTPFGEWRPGSAATNVQITSTLMARLSEDPGSLDGLVLLTEIYDSTGARRTWDWSQRHAAATDPDIVDEWQAVDAPGLFPRTSANFRARSLMVLNDADWIDIDRIRQVQRTMTGSLSPVPLETLLRRVVARAQSEHCGGRLGVTVKVHTPSGASDAMWWEHADDPTVEDPLSSICDRSDGPDAWFTPDRVLHTDKRAGRDRTDLVLNSDTVITARLAPNPSMRYLESRVRVGPVAGPTRQVVGANRRAPGVIPRRHQELGPTELSFRATEPWAAGRAEVLALQHQNIEVTVPDWYGRAFGLGDRVGAGLDVEGLAVDGIVRVIRIENVPPLSAYRLTCVTDVEET